MRCRGTVCGGIFLALGLLILFLNLPCEILITVIAFALIAVGVFLLCSCR